MKKIFYKIISSLIAGSMVTAVLPVGATTLSDDTSLIVYTEDFENGTVGQSFTAFKTGFSSVEYDNSLQKSSEGHSNSAVISGGSANKNLEWTIEMSKAEGNTAVGIRFNFADAIDPAEGVIDIGFSVKYTSDTEQYPGTNNYAFRGGFLGNSKSGNTPGWDSFQRIGMTSYVGSGGIAQHGKTTPVIGRDSLCRQWYDLHFTFDGAAGTTTMKYKPSDSAQWTVVGENYDVPLSSNYAPYTFFAFVMGNNASGSGAGIARYYFDNIIVKQGTTPDAIYVSPNGSDSNPGTADKPFATIGKAMQLWEFYGNKPTIYLMEGTHYIDETITLDSRFAGISFSAYNNRPVTISAAYRGGDIRSATGEDCGGNLPYEHIGSIIRWDVSGYANLADDAITSDFGYYNAELTDGGKAQTIARWPDKDWAYTGMVTKDISNVEYEFVTTAPLDNMTLDNAKMNGFQSWDYRLTKSNVTGLGDADNSLRIKANAIIDSEHYFHSNRRYYLYNIPEEINTPGEYYIDYDEKAVYYYPREGGYSLELTALKDGMFVLNSGADNVTFYGITFEGCRGTAIKASGADNITIDSCIVKNIGGRGVYISDTYNTTITKSRFVDIGDSSIELVGSGDRVNLIDSGNTINNCMFENGARVVGTYAPFIQLGETSAEGGANMGAKVENNYFVNHMHSAIIFEGNDYIIRNNIFDNAVNATQDAGCIYSRVNPTYRGNVISNNIFRNIRSFKPDEKYADVHCIYCDDLLSGVTVDSNVFYSCSSVANFGGGSGNKFNNNLVYDCTEGAHYGTRGNIVGDAKISYVDDKGVTKSGYLWMHYNRMKNDAGGDLSKWFEKYPDFEQFASDIEQYNSEENIASDYTMYTDSINVKYAQYDNNLYIGPKADNSDFYTVKAYDADTGYGVQVTNLYQSTELSDASVDGADVRVNVDGYSAPDVSDAGIIQQNNIYSFATGRVDNGIGFVHPNSYFRGYRYESFDGYADGSDVSAAGELDISGDAVIAESGCADMSADAQITIKTPLPLSGSFAFAIMQKGNTIVTFGDGQSYSTGDCEQNTLCEFVYDGSNMSLYTHRAGGNYVLSYSEAVGDIGTIGNIIIDALTDTAVDAIGLSAYNNGYKLKEGYVDMNFEDCSGNSVAAEEYSADWFTYGAYGRNSFTIEERSVGNNALRAVFDTYDGSARNDILELMLPDIKMLDNIVNIEFTYASSNTDVDFTRFVELVGYNTGTADEEYIFSNVLKFTDGVLKTTWGTEVATLEEVASGVSIRLSYDKANQTVSVYKKSNGEWQEIYLNRPFKTEFPHYLTKLRFTVHLPKSETVQTKEFWLDDIRVYSYDGRQLLNNSSAQTSVSSAFGRTVHMSPEYIAGSGIHSLCAAIYDEDGNMLQARLAPYLPGANVTLDVPWDAIMKPYYVQRFMLQDMTTIRPVMPMLEYN